jgi:hypothetical protein
MKDGSKYAEMLARSPPLSDEALIATEHYFGFKYRSVLGACVHLVIWTRLDILLACVVLAQFQTSTGVEHYEALKHLVGYLRRNPDVPLTYCRQRFDASVSLLDIQINETDPLTSEIFSSSSYHVGSVDLITRTQDLIVASALLFETDEARQVLPGAIRDDTPISIPKEPSLPDETVVDAKIATFPESVDDPINQLPTSSSLPRTAPFTESFVDDNLPGGIFEKIPFLGFTIKMAGTCLFPLCCKAETHADNTTESEMDAANRLGKGHRWMRLYMEDLGLPFTAPIPAAEDNAVTRIIAHPGKITRNTWHIALKTLSPQALVRKRITMFRAIGSDNNRSDHFTKDLPYPAFSEHCSKMMGLRFLNFEHAMEYARLRSAKDG